MSIPKDVRERMEQLIQQIDSASAELQKIMTVNKVPTFSTELYANRYKKLRDLVAHDCYSHPLSVRGPNNVMMFQGEILDKFVDQVRD